MEIKKVVVVGMGLMGSGIAQTYAEGGCEVYVTDVAEELDTLGIRVGIVDKGNLPLRHAPFDQPCVQVIINIETPLAWC